MLKAVLPGSLQTTFLYPLKYVVDSNDKLASKEDQRLLKRKRMYGLASIYTGMCLDVSEKEGQKDHIIRKDNFLWFFLSLISFSQ